jgi:hypothetical protein
MNNHQNAIFHQLGDCMKHSHSFAMTIFHTITKSGGPPTMPSQSGISSEGTSLIERLSNIVFGKFFSNVSQIALSNSFAHMVSKPAASNPYPNHRHLQRRHTFYHYPSQCIGQPNRVPTMVWF